MSLIKCSECGKEVSDKSNKCIYCGCPMEINKGKKIKKPGKAIKEDDSDLKNKKFHISKKLKVILIIIGCIFVLGVFSNDSSNSSDDDSQIKALCRKNVKYGYASGSETVFLNESGKNTKIEKKISVHAQNFDSGTKELGETSIVGLCSEETKNANSHTDSYSDCTANDGNDINTKYIDDRNIEEILNEYKNNSYQCITYSNNSSNIVGNWCLEFDDNGNKNSYLYIFDNKGYYTEKQVSGENGKYVSEGEGYYSFDGANINQISFVKGAEFYGSAYLDFLTYDESTDTITDSNIKSEFPNVFTRCNEE